jgi:hypothetical protein
MVEEVEKLELGHGPPEVKLQEPYYGGNENELKMNDRRWREVCRCCPYIEFGARACTMKKVLLTEGFVSLREGS